MKRFFILLFALALVPCFGGLTAVKAEGLKITVKGQWDFSFGRIVNEGFNDSANRSLPGALRPHYGRPSATNHSWPASACARKSTLSVRNT